MIAQADCFRIPLPDKSVHCVTTSPPYWGLRKYSGEQGEEPLGLESTPERHIERIVEIMREVKRVLRDDGVLWLNYGDCYSNAKSGGRNDTERMYGANSQHLADKVEGLNVSLSAPQGSLMMMPHRVALALQADGWIVRQDLVWYKRNPMPESVNGWRWQRERTEGRRVDGGGMQKGNKGSLTNMSGGLDRVEWEYGEDFELKRGSWRHTRAHEYVFMLVKGMQYWSNQEAVREPHDRLTKWGHMFGKDGMLPHERAEKFDSQKQNSQQGKDAGMSTLGNKRWGLNPGGRNPRSVLDVPTAPYRGAHYATFPPNLIAPLIRATCPRWACPVCGQGWAAVVDREATNHKHFDHGERTGGAMTGGVGKNFPDVELKTIGYRPTCEHPHTQEEAIPGIVFDPFVGSGTTVMVAQDLLRRGIGIDLSMEYLDLQAKLRVGQGSPSNQFENLPLFENESPPNAV